MMAALQWTASVLVAIAIVALFVGAMIGSAVLVSLVAVGTTIGGAVALVAVVVRESWVHYRTNKKKKPTPPSP